ncbi:MAG: LamG-like jellyroll fold domain-containing protein [Spirochaetota bacterium]
MERIVFFILASAALCAQNPALWVDFTGVTGDCTDKAGNAVIVKGASIADGAFRSKKGNDCTVKTSAALNAMTTEIAITAWIALKTVDENFQTVLFKGDRSRNPEAIQYALSINYGYPELKWKDEKGVWQGFMKSSTDTKTGAVKNAVRLGVGKWQHLAVTFANGAICVYVNGALTEKAPAKEGAKAFVASETDIYPGAMFWTTSGRNYHQDGLIADIRVYSSVLDAAAIKDIVSGDAKRSVNADIVIE